MYVTIYATFPPQEYDEFASLSRRRYVPPNFAEIRHILNIAQLHASAEELAMITFDADGTIYADGHHMKDDNKMIGHIVALMKRGISVAIVTAAGVWWCLVLCCNRSLFDYRGRSAPQSDMCFTSLLSGHYSKWFLSDNLIGQ